MYRFIENDLRLWKEGTRRKPLILRGARQVGKTWSIKEFGSKQLLLAKRCSFLTKFRHVPEP